MSSIAQAEAPKIQPFHFPSKIRPDQRIQTFCGLVDSSASVRFTWRRNGIPIGSSDQWNIANHPGFSVLTLDKVKIDQSGNYTCTASSSEGEDSYTAILIVTGESSSESLVLESGSDEEIYHCFVFILTARANVSLSKLLPIKPEARTWIYLDFSIYCRMEGVHMWGLRMIFWALLVLTMVAETSANMAPKIQPFFFPAEIQLGQRVRVFCQLQVEMDDVEYSWKMDGKPLGSLLGLSVSNHPAFSQLVISKATVDHSGNYTCLASTASGTDSFTAQLLITGAIDDPECLCGKRKQDSSHLLLECPIFQNYRNRENIEYKDLFIRVRGSGQEVRAWIYLNFSIYCRMEGVHMCGLRMRFWTLLVVLTMVAETSANMAPKIQPFFFPAEVRLGQRVRVFCQLQDEIGEVVHFTWKMDGKPLESTAGLTIGSHPGFSQITISKAAVDHSGNYTCLASTASGTDSFTAQLLITGNPAKVPKADNIAARSTYSPKRVTRDAGTQLNNRQKRALSKAREAFILLNEGLKLHPLPAKLVIVSKGESTPAYIPYGLRCRKCLRQEHRQTTCPLGINRELHQDTQQRPVSKPPSYKPMPSNNFALSTPAAELSAPIKRHVNSLQPCRVFTRGEHLSPSTSQLPSGSEPSLTITELTEAPAKEIQDMTASSIQSTTPMFQVEFPSRTRQEKKLEEEVEQLFVQLNADTFLSPLYEEIYKNELVDAVDYFWSQRLLEKPRNGIYCRMEGVHMCGLRIRFWIIVVLTMVAETSANMAPKIQPFTFPVEVRLGQRIRVLCQLQDERDDVQYSWKLDGKLLTSTAVLSIGSHPGFSLLTISKAAVDHSGNYTCLAATASGTDSFTAQLLITAMVMCLTQIISRNVAITTTIPLGRKSWIQVAIVILMVCSTSTVDGKEIPKLQPFIFPSPARDGQSLQVICGLSSGGGDVRFSWTRDGTPLVPSDVLSISHHRRYSILALDKIAVTDSGNYTCTAQNPDGLDSQSAILAVHATVGCQGKISNIDNDGQMLKFDSAAPKIQPFHFPPSVQVGQRIQAFCGLINGGGSTTFSWKVNGKFVEQSVGPWHIANHPGFSHLTVEQVDVSTAGNYTCVARNDLGTDEYSANLIVKESVVTMADRVVGILILLDLGLSCLAAVLEPPSILPFHFPESGDGPTSAQAFCSLRKGTGDVEFSWQHNDKRISSNDHVTITTHPRFSVIYIDMVSSVDSGNYTCVATNNAGSDSFTALLLVRGGERMLIAQALCGLSKGDGDISFLWYHNGRLLTSSGHVTVTTHPRFSVILIDKISSLDSGNYTCVVSNSAGRDSFTALLLVRGILPFSFPEGKTRTSNAQAFCGLSKGDGDLTFSWQLNGRPLSSSGHITITTHPRFSVLYIDKLSSVDSGNYTCVATNSAGSDSFTALLMVRAIEAPSILPFHFPEGGDGSLITQALCGLRKGGGSIEFSWFHNGRPIPSSGHVTITSQPSFSVISISKLSSMDSGNYTCVASNSAGRDSFTALLLVRGRTRTVNAQALCGLSKGDGDITFSWQHNGRPLTSSGHFTITTHPRFSVIYIDKLSSVDSGNYTCVASNSAGRDSFTAPLMVREGGDGSSITQALCGLRKGGGAIEFSWHHNGKLISSSGHITITTQPRFSVIYFDKLSSLDSGNYTCVASNSAGRDSFTAILLVRDGDGSIFAQALCGLRKGDGDIEFTWYHNGKPMTSSGHITITTHPKFSVIYIDKVSSDDSGNYTCVASNSAGRDAFTAILLVRGTMADGAPSIDVFVIVGVFLVMDTGFFLIPTVSASALEPPSILPFHFPDAGDGTIFAQALCGLRKGDGDIEFKWYHNGKPVISSGHVTITTHPRFSAIYIDKISSEDSGNYTCVASNSAGRDAFTAILLVRGGDGTLIAQAYCSLRKGGGDIQFSWQHNGQTLSSAEHVTITTHPRFSVLYFDKVSSEDSGNYTCVASNSAGRDAFTALLMVRAPKIQPFHFPPNVQIDQRVQAFCGLVNGGGTIVFTWKIDGIVITSSAKLTVANHPGYSLLTVDKVDVDNAGNYTCQARNHLGEDQYTTQLVVKEEYRMDLMYIYGAYAKWIYFLILILVVDIGEAVKIRPFHFPSPVHEGQSVQVVCGLLSPSDGVVFSWTRDGIPLESDSELSVGTHFGISVLAISSARTWHAGNYTCSASSGLSDTDSFSDILHIQANLKVRPFHFPSPVQEGNSVQVVCGLHNPVEDVQFSWTKDGLSLQVDPHLSVVSHLGISVLAITSAKTEHAGNYTCKASSGFLQSDSFSDILQIEGLRAMTTALKVRPFHFPSPVPEGHTVQVVCGLHKSEDGVRFTWTRDGIPLESDSTLSIVNHPGISLLAISSAGSEQAGNYTCTATGPGMDTDSFSDVLHIQALKVRPFHFPSPVPEGHTVQVVCALHKSEEGVKFTWTRDGKSLEVDPDLSVVDHFGISVLAISSARSRHAGNYTCTASLPTDSDSFSDLLRIQDEEEERQAPLEFWWRRVRKTPELRSQEMASVRITTLTLMMLIHVQVRSDLGLGSGMVFALKVRPFHFPSPVQEGHSVQVMCALLKSEKEVQFSWIRDGVLLESDADISVGTQFGISVLAINNVQSQHSGNYTCKAVNLQSNSVDMYSDILQVQESVWCVEKEDMATRIVHRIVYLALLVFYSEALKVRPFHFPSPVQEGHAVQVVCGLLSSEEGVQFSWTRDGVPIESGTDISVGNQFGISVLAIGNARSHHSGNYTCTANNRFSDTDSYSDILHIQARAKRRRSFFNADHRVNGYRPRMNNFTIFKGYQWNLRWITLNILVILFFSTEALKVRPFHFPSPVQEGHSVQIVCGLQIPVPDVQFIWLHDGKVIESDNDFNIVTNFGLSVLAINSASTRHSGNYTCQVRDPKMDMDSYSDMLQVQARARRRRPFFNADHRVNGYRPRMDNFTLLKGFPWNLRWITLNILVILFFNTEALKVRPFQFPSPVQEGHSVQIVCGLQIPVPDVQFIWLHDGKVIESNEDFNIATPFGISVLHINGASSRHSGNYTCQVRSSKMDMDSYSDMLHVQEFWWRRERRRLQLQLKSQDMASVRFTTLALVMLVQDKLNLGPKMVTALKVRPFHFPSPVQEGHSVQVMCALLKSEEGVQFSWIRDGILLESGPDISVGTQFDISVLSIRSVQSQHSGNYTCKATNAQSFSDTYSDILQVQARARRRRPFFNADHRVNGYRPRMDNFTLFKGYQWNLRWITVNILVILFFSTEALKVRPFHFPSPVQEGQSVQIVCGLLNPITDVQFTWFHDGKVIETGEDFNIATPFGISVLHINGASTRHSGNYTCQVRSSQMDMDSYSDMLHVQEEERQAPLEFWWRRARRPLQLQLKSQDMESVRFTTLVLVMLVQGRLDLGPKMVTALKVRPFHFPSPVQEGHSVQVMCALLKSEEGVQFSWIRDGLPLESGPDISVMTHFDISVLSIRSVQSQHSGNYTCKVTNAQAITDTYSDILQVQGSGKITFSWEINDMPSTSSSTRWNVENRPGFSVLTVDKVDVDSAGNYTCVARNSFGEDRYTARLVVTARARRRRPFFNADHRVNGYRPRMDHFTLLKGYQWNLRWITLNIMVILFFSTEALKVRPFQFPSPVQEGHSVQIVCGLQIPVPDVQFIWLHDGKVIESGEYFDIATHFGLSVLAINGATSRHSGNYTCQVRGPQMDMDSYSDMLQVQGRLTYTTIKLARIAIFQLVSARARRRRPFFNADHRVNGYRPRMDNFTLFKGYQWNLRWISLNILVILFFSTEALKVRPFHFPSPVQEGQSVQVVCGLLNPVPDVQFTWLFEGSPIESGLDFNIATHFGLSVLAINGASSRHSGNYTCKVTSPQMDTDSYSDMLQVQALLKVRPFHFPDIVHEGQAVQVMCGLEKMDQGVVFTWTKDGLPLMSSEDLTIMSSIGVSMLSIHHARMTDSANYSCKATNQNMDTDSFSDTLKIQAVRIRPFHLPEVVQEGQAVQVTCGLKRMDPGVVFSWTKDGLPLASSSDLTIFSSVGVSILSIHSAKPADSGNYTCKAINSQSEFDSFSDLLKVQALKVRPFHFPSVVQEGQAVQVTCGLQKTESGVVLSWMKDGIPLSSNEDLTILSSIGVSMLAIHSTKSEDNGNYTCKVVNSHSESDSYSDTLTIQAVKVRPFHFPELVHERQAVQIMCGLLESEQGVVFTWTKDGVPLESSDTLTILSSIGGSMLAIHSAKPSDSGNYTCRARNDLSDMDSFSDILKIQVSCVLQRAEKDVDFTWFKDGVPLKSDENLQVSNQLGISIFLLTNAKAEHSGNYSCVAKNSRMQTDTYASLLLVQDQMVQASCVLQNKEEHVEFFWFKDGKPLDDENIKISNLHSGMSMFFLSEAKSEHSGNYSCVAKNDRLLSDTVSSILLVQASANLRIRPFHFPKLVLENQLVQVTCALEEAASDVEFQWFKDGQLLLSTEDLRLSNQFGISLFLLTKARSHHSGNYTCVAKSGGYQTDSFSSFLTIQEDHRVQVSCLLQKEEKELDLKWLKDGKLLKSDDNLKISNQFGISMLFLSKAKPEHSGNYTCVATSSRRDSDSFSALLLVREIGLKASTSDMLHQHPECLKGSRPRKRRDVLKDLRSRTS
ncbi:Dscam [Cordylochernes scorpioides]|uniref:Dscam n=1 Tax=Cordylochernes scorpioides TaxID=51811 RepID=A0ABY6K0E1_9ARAC|nr:Dscam [Cordylochernes scorpioides]